MDDTALLRQLARDRDGSFEALVLAYQDRLYRFALRLSNSPADAEEVAQDAFVRAYAALGRYPAERILSLALRPWLYRITINVFRNRLRRHRLSTVSLDDEDSLEASDEPLDWGIELAERAQLLQCVIASLPERYRVPLVMRHICELDYCEIAQALGQPEGTVKSNVHRGLLLLREARDRELADLQPIEVPA